MTTTTKDPIIFLQILPEEITKGFLEAPMPDKQRVYTFTITSGEFCILGIDLYSQLQHQITDRKTLPEGVFTLKDNSDWDNFLDKTVGEHERGNSQDPLKDFKNGIVGYDSAIIAIRSGELKDSLTVGDGVHQEKIILRRKLLFEMIKNAYS